MQLSSLPSVILPINEKPRYPGDGSKAWALAMLTQKECLISLGREAGKSVRHRGW